MDLLVFVHSNWQRIFNSCGDNVVLICKHLRDMFNNDGSRRVLMIDPFAPVTGDINIKPRLGLVEAKMMADWVLWKARERSIYPQ